MYPNHPNLLPAYYDNPFFVDQSHTASIGKIHKMNWVSKPLYGREGIGVFKSQNFSSYKEFIKVTENNFGQDRESSDKLLGKSIY